MKWLWSLRDRFGLENLFGATALAAAFLMTVQLELALVMAVRHLPIHDPLTPKVFPEWQNMLRPEHEAALFHGFLFLAMLFSVGAAMFWQRAQVDYQRFRQLATYAAFELLMTVLLMVCAYKVAVCPQRPQLASGAFWIMAALALAGKIFWPELGHLVSAAWGRLWMWERRGWLWLVVSMGLIVILLYVPDVNAVLARMFVGEQFHHFDSFMAPVWGYASGGVLNMSIMSEYGIGLPVVVADIARLCGGISYAHVFDVWLWMTIIYFISLLVFMRLWLGSLALALAGVLLAIKWQMFHFGVTPFVFTYPSATVMRFWPDVVFFILLWLHLRYQRNIFAALAGVVAGFAIFSMTTMGYCLTVAFYGYVAACLVFPQLRRLFFNRGRQWGWLLLWVVIVPAAAGGFFYLVQGPTLWSAEFWHNMREFNGYFLNGFGLMPMAENLQHREVLAFAMGLLVPLVYVATFLVLGSWLLFAGAEAMLALPLILCFYGLAIDHYYVARSAVTSYEVVIVPYVCILAFWLGRWMAGRAVPLRRVVLAAVFGIIIFSLASNHNYVGYPNLLNVSRNPIVDPRIVQPLPGGRSYFNQLFSQVPDDQKLPVNDLGQTQEDLKYEKDFANDAQLKAYYLKESDFSADVKLIDALIPPGQAVPLLSSFEIKMLIEAHRRPFFYHSPILIARPMRMRIFPNSTMYTWGQARRVLKHLEASQPKYIFMEKVFLLQDHNNLYKDPALLAIVQYINGHYKQVAQGQYLAAMQLQNL